MRPVDASPLAVLRFVLGVTFAFWATGYLSDERWHILFVQPLLLFKYDGFEWVTLWPDNGMWWHFQLTRAAAICFALGFLTRINAFLLAASMTYVLLVDRQIYNNHDYLLACTAMLCVFLPCGRVFSIDRLLFGRSTSEPSMLRWHWWLVRFQLGLPYVFGGIAKLDSDWLAGQPAGLFVDARVDVPLIGPLFAQPLSATVMAWGGLLFDLLVVPALMCSRTRLFAILAALAFHVTNATIFQIGVFPWFMIATLFVFFPVTFVPGVVQQIRMLIRSSDGSDSAPMLQSSFSNSGFARAGVARAGVAMAVVYVIIQLLLPIRPWILPGNPSWNERGQRFAWRMMLRHKDCLLWFKIESEDDFLFVPAKLVMSPNQVTRAPRDPELVRQAAVKLNELAESMGQFGCRVYALDLVSLNGRPAKPLVDPDQDLTQVERGWFFDDWVLQDPGPLMETPWRLPIDQWWQHTEVPDRFIALQSMYPSEAERLFDQLAARQRAAGNWDVAK